MINTRIQTDLVEDYDTGFPRCGIELTHGGGDVTGGHYMCLPFDGSLDDIGVVGVGNQRYDEIVRGHGGFESGGIGSIKGGCCRSGKALSELLRVLNRATR